jgi:transitional endoplasmic reticulum ATPase
MKIVSDIPSGEDSTTFIFECTGQKLEPETARDLWPKILQHKWFLSEKLGRDVGTKVACLDFMENVKPMHRDNHDAEGIQLLKELGAQMVDQSVGHHI